LYVGTALVPSTDFKPGKKPTDKDPHGIALLVKEIVAAQDVRRSHLQNSHFQGLQTEVVSLQKI